MVYNRFFRLMGEFDCCGGNDDRENKQHTQDCPEHGNPEWIAELDYFEETGKYWTKEQRKQWRQRET